MDPMVHTVASSALIERSSGASGGSEFAILPRLTTDCRPPKQVAENLFF
ncbi:MAG: hypothetical protein IPK82_22285 [Polyangiaceae bacterium]|nr:hypothetical protein [Polyangiaceae bacterium]